MSFVIAAALLASAPTQPDRVFVNVDIVDVENGTLIEDKSVLVSNNRIAAILDDEAALPEGVDVIEGEGRYLMPGLADMHVHFQNADWIPLWIAEGITTVRLMWGKPEPLRVREAIRAGDLIGPQIVMAGPVLGGSPTQYAHADAVDNVETARHMVRRTAAEGYDFVKLVANLEPDVYAAIVDEADTIGIGFAGHVSKKVGIYRMIEDGALSLEHAYGFDEAELADDYLDMGWSARARALRTGSIPLDTMFPPEKRARLAAALEKAGTAVVPTLSVFESLRLTCAQHQSRMAREEMRYVLPFHVEWWDTESPCPRGEEGDRTRLEGRIAELIDAADLRAFIDADVMLLSGSDSANPLIIPAIGLHEELGYMVKDGLTPAEALRTSTINVARYLREDDHQRRVAVGAEADLVLLSANPLDDIANTRAIEGVMVDGRWLNRASLDAFKDWTAQAVAHTAKVDDRVAPR